MTLACFRRFELLEREVSLAQSLAPVELVGGILRVWIIGCGYKASIDVNVSWKYPSAMPEISGHVQYGDFDFENRVAKARALPCQPGLFSNIIKEILPC